VDKRTKESLKQVSLIVSSNGNYREAIDSDSQAPAVPILTIHLRHLRRSYEDIQTHVVEHGEELVDFQNFQEVRGGSMGDQG
jgi:hypothetical protein